MVLSLIGGAVFAGLAGFLAWDRHELCVATIEGSLRRFHARDITVAIDWFGFDRHTFTYDVEFTDGEGRRQANRCRINVSPGADHEAIYWQHPLPSA
jgi:hypothetical protein